MDSVAWYITYLCDNQEPLLREQAVNALGRIGRSNYHIYGGKCI